MRQLAWVSHMPHPPFEYIWCRLQAPRHMCACNVPHAQRTAPISAPVPPTAPPSPKQAPVCTRRPHMTRAKSCSAPAARLCAVAPPARATMHAPQRVPNQYGGRHAAVSGDSRQSEVKRTRARPSAANVHISATGLFTGLASVASPRLTFPLPSPPNQDASRTETSDWRGLTPPEGLLAIKSSRLVCGQLDDDDAAIVGRRLLAEFLDELVAHLLGCRVHLASNLGNRLVRKHVKETIGAEDEVPGRGGRRRGRAGGAQGAAGVGQGAGNRYRHRCRWNRWEGGRGGSRGGGRGRGEGAREGSQGTEGEDGGRRGGRRKGARARAGGALRACAHLSSGPSSISVISGSAIRPGLVFHGKSPRVRDGMREPQTRPSEISPPALTTRLISPARVSIRALVIRHKCTWAGAYAQRTGAAELVMRGCARESVAR